MLPHRVKVLCPAKVNLGLEVLERDHASGYHRLCSLVQSIDLFDELLLELDADAAAPSGEEPPRLELAGPFAADAPVDNNLVLTAWALAGGSLAFPPLKISLVKNIPAQSGLGGGSSDAAGMLLALRELARLLAFDGASWPAGGGRLSDAQRLEQLRSFAELPRAELLALAARLGSDVPALLAGGLQLVEGFGERLTGQARQHDYFLLLAVPRFVSATGPAFTALERDHEPRAAKSVPRLAEVLSSAGVSDSAASGEHPLAAAGELLNNDFESVLLPQWPQYLDWFQRLLGLGALAVSLSGSGSAFYGIFATEARAGSALARLQENAGEFRYIGVHRPLGG